MAVPTSSLIAAYANRFDGAIADGSHSVGSPLGAWLQLALVASAADGDDRRALEEVLGTDVRDAQQRAMHLIEDPHPAVKAAIALWHRPDRVTTAFDSWASTLPSVTERGPVPSPSAADAWARRVTDGMIEGIALDDSAPVVLANALATRVGWASPFDVDEATALGGAWSSKVRRVLRTPREPQAREGSGHDMQIMSTDVGLVAVHVAESVDRVVTREMLEDGAFDPYAPTSGLLVVSVVADPQVAEGDVRRVAHDIALAVADVAPRGARPERVSLLALPLGDGPAWRIAEGRLERGFGSDPEQFHAWLPSWRARSTVALDAHRGLGFDVVADVMGRFAVVDMGTTSTQEAVARFDRRGFEASAITTWTTGVAHHSNVVRSAELRFAHPYAVVAVATEPMSGDAWHGVPVFSAWVAEPTEPTDDEFD